MPQGINTGEILEALNDKMDRDGHNVESPSATVIETYSNGTDWYRVWSDGWCEQGGFAEANGQITLLKAFSNTDYTITLGCFDGNNGTPRASSKQTTGFYYDSANVANCPSYWEAKGYIS